MLPAWLTARVPPTCSCYLCAPLPKGATSKLHTPPLSGLVPPQLLFQVPPGFLGPALQNPVPQNPAPGWGGAREGHHVPHTKEGGRPGDGPHRQLLQQPLGSSPSLPKAAGAPRLGPNLEGRGRFNKNITLTFFPRWGLFCNMTCRYLYKNECYNEAPWLLFECVWITLRGIGLGPVVREGWGQCCSCPNEGFTLLPTWAICSPSGGIGELSNEVFHTFWLRTTYSSWPLNTGLSCTGPLICRLLSTNTSYSTVRSMVGWIHGCGTTDREGQL